MITVENLSFSYAGSDSETLRNLHFSVQKGEVFGFLGPSGAGKSTTQKIVTGLLYPFRGNVDVLGHPVSDWGSDLYNHIGVSFEFPNHYLKLTARENLVYFSKLFSGETEDPEILLERVGLQADAEIRVSQFSKGMKNRLTVARALLNKPEVLFLDEPTAGLDPVNARRIMDLIGAEVEAGRTVFLTTHDMQVADTMCDRVAFIVGGQISTIDTPSALKIKHGTRSVKIVYLVGGTTQTIQFELDGLHTNERFQEIMALGTVQTIHTTEASLSDVFIQVTGTRLE